MITKSEKENVKGVQIVKTCGMIINVVDEVFHDRFNALIQRFQLLVSFLFIIRYCNVIKSILKHSYYEILTCQVGVYRICITLHRPRLL
jgi:hypothetical protein